MKLSSRRCPFLPPRSAFAGFRFPPDVIMVAARLYLRYNLPRRRGLLIERGVEVDYVTVFCWMQRFTPLLASARSSRRTQQRPVDQSAGTTTRFTGTGR
ncbi:hypothetical protein [Dactylosporangium sp. NPDC050588]|uniref:hypothetical protein n=1 Tax=Dactylosporangium sp. NPDC050588 TaxID=3157211 RepID=UPI0033FCD446